MKKRKRRIIAVLLCWMLCGTTASGAVQEGEVTTTIRSGEVRIRMHRYGDEKKEKGWEDLEHILPGQKITMITEIENLGENCLIRYQMTAEAKSNREIPISSFSGIPGNCVRKGEYFYHTDVVKHGETVRLFTAFTLPETWEQGGEDEIRIHVAADAIQSRNFTPDFTSEHPWGDQVIQKVSGKTGDQLRILAPRKGTCRVVLEGDDIITVPDTFFAEFGTLVPGDVIQGELQIDNRSGRPEDVYWKLETEEELLLEQAELWVEKEDGTVLCQGSPSEQSLGQFAFLETYEQNEKENLIFFLRLPEDMDNTYRLRESTLTWTFRAVSEDTTVPAGQESVKTGENSHVILYGCMAGGALLTGILLIKRRRRRHG